MVVKSAKDLKVPLLTLMETGTDRLEELAPAFEKVYNKLCLRDKIYRIISKGSCWLRCS